MDQHNTKCDGFLKQAELYNSEKAEDCPLYAGFYSDEKFWCCDLYDAFDGYVCEVGDKDKPAQCCYASQEKYNEKDITFNTLATCPLESVLIFGSVASTCADGEVYAGGIGDGQSVCCPYGYTVAQDYDPNSAQRCCTSNIIPITETPALETEPQPSPTPTPTSTPECENDDDCDNCGRCNNGTCVDSCTDCQECVDGECKSKEGCGRCEEGVWIGGCPLCQECLTGSDGKPDVC